MKKNQKEGLALILAGLLALLFLGNSQLSPVPPTNNQTGTASVHFQAASYTFAPLIGALQGNLLVADFVCQSQGIASMSANASTTWARVGSQGQLPNGFIHEVWSAQATSHLPVVTVTFSSTAFCAASLDSFSTSAVNPVGLVMSGALTLTQAQQGVGTTASLTETNLTPGYLSIADFWSNQASNGAINNAMPYVNANPPLIGTQPVCLNGDPCLFTDYPVLVTAYVFQPSPPSNQSLSFTFSPYGHTLTYPYTYAMSIATFSSSGGSGLTNGLPLGWILGALLIASGAYVYESKGHGH